MVFLFFEGVFRVFFDLLDFFWIFEILGLFGFFLDFFGFFF